MANTINWGQIYCDSWWGDEDNKLGVPEFPADCQLYGGVCGTQYSYAAGQSFPTRYAINLTQSGVIDFEWETYGIPDKFIVIQNDVILADTGYRGDVSYQSALNAALAALGLPSETITAGTTGTESNITVTNDTLYIYVYAPLSGTSWNFTVTCPLSRALYDYKARVESDGGTYEASPCLTNIADTL